MEMLGRRSWHAITDEVKNSVTELFLEKYYDHNFSHVTERLNEEEEITISLASVRGILKADGIFWLLEPSSGLRQ